DPTTGGGVRVAPPRPLIAGPVLDQLQSARSRLPGEPLPQRVVLPGPREPVVTTRPVVPSDRDQLVPHPVERPDPGRTRGDHDQLPSCIGTRTPRCRATSAAAE